MANLFASLAPRRRGVDLPALYRQMARVRAFEETQADLWNQGLISGEMHLTK